MKDHSPQTLPGATPTSTAARASRSRKSLHSPEHQYHILQQRVPRQPQQPHGARLELYVQARRTWLVLDRRVIRPERLVDGENRGEMLGVTWRGRGEGEGEGVLEVGR